MTWHLASIIRGVEIRGLTTGRHVYAAVDRATGMVRVIGAGGVTAVLRPGVAGLHLRAERRPADGSPVRVRNQDVRWDRLRGWRRFDQRRGLTA